MDFKNVMQLYAVCNNSLKIQWDRQIESKMMEKIYHANINF